MLIRGPPWRTSASLLHGFMPPLSWCFHDGMRLALPLEDARGSSSMSGEISLSARQDSEGAYAMRVGAMLLVS